MQPQKLDECVCKVMAPREVGISLAGGAAAAILEAEIGGIVNRQVLALGKLPSPPPSDRALTSNAAHAVSL